MRVGIDASNLRSGGGITHMTELLLHAEPERFGVDRVVVWGNRETIARLPSNAKWLKPVAEPMLNGSLPKRLFWQRWHLPKLAQAECDLVFVPGGTYHGSFHPVVTMCRNMLPFDSAERWRYVPSYIFFRLTALRYLQGSSFERADGVIFLTSYAEQVVSPSASNHTFHAVIPHGVSDRFRREPVAQRPLANYTTERPFRLLYISIIDLYKHQWNVAEAVLRLRQEGLPIELDLVGPAYGPALARVHAVLSRYPDHASGVRIRGSVDHADLPAVYHRADAFVFASTCENMPNILVEAMAAGLPIASSDRPPMPEVLGDTGVYFDAESADSIAATLRQFLHDPQLRAEKAKQAHARAAQFSWRRCAEETFAFFVRVAQGRRAE